MLMHDADTPSFAGHESFTLRYGWLKKAIDAVSEDPHLFARDDALITLGVGKNMVRSIRHWALATGVLEESATDSSRVKGLVPSELGRLLMGGRGKDPYLEDVGSLWALHWMLASKPATSPTTWLWAFNFFPDLEFTKAKFITGLRKFTEQHGWKQVAESSLSRDVDCFIRTYVSGTAIDTIPEESLDCPFTELGLLQEYSDEGKFYSFARGEHPSLSPAMFTFALLQFWTTSYSSQPTMTFEHVAYRQGSPGRVFKLSENVITNYLEAIERITDKAITYDVTAGLRQLYKRATVRPLDMLAHHYVTKGVKG